MSKWRTYSGELIINCVNAHSQTLNERRSAQEHGARAGPALGTLAVVSISDTCVASARGSSSCPPAAAE